ncbi:hypothetical protein C8R47DRAFT_1159266 [Mycena vitilis]|nr:hypothetical protein C8R47DRAFT_1159266 [Mycena vitilis]
MRRLQTTLPALSRQIFHRSALLSTTRTRPHLATPAALSTAMVDQSERNPVSLRFNPQYKQLFDHCYDAASPIGAGFSRDWDEWECIDFFRVRDTWLDITPAELHLNLIYKLPKPIVPLAFLNAHDYHLLFEAGAEYYYFDGADGHLFQYETRFGDRDDFLENFLEKGHMKKVPWPEDAEMIADATRAQQNAAKREHVRLQIASKAARGS